MAQKRVLLLGSTGSIGDSTTRVVRDLPDRLRLVALAAHRNWRALLEQIREHRPAAVALSDPNAASELRSALASESDAPAVYEGAEGLVELVRAVEGDVLVAAISGAAGLPANIAALETGKDLALANKESLVMSGAILIEKARQEGRRILPVDSEHNAIFQALEKGRVEEVRAILLTASGGPFREHTLEQLRHVTRAQALDHPTWDMGAKITVDSATLMNKALEIIEARWLFDVPPEMIEVVVHPQSMVHSLVEYRDGSTLCQMGPPDMRVPIQYALTYPERQPLAVDRLDLPGVGQLTFERPDPERFPALRLAYEVLATGGTAPTVFNAANEVAVAAFLEERIPFLAIVETIEACLSEHQVIPDARLPEIFAADTWAREAARSLIERVTAR